MEKSCAAANLTGELRELACQACEVRARLLPNVTFAPVVKYQVRLNLDMQHTELSSGQESAIAYGIQCAEQDVLPTPDPGQFAAVYARLYAEQH